MLQPGTGFYIWASLGIVCALTCLIECELCPLEGVYKPVDLNTCCDIGLQNAYPSLLDSEDCEHECQDKVSDLFSCSSTLYDSYSKEQCSSKQNLDVDISKSGVGRMPYQFFRNYGNFSWSSDDFVFNFRDGLTLACFLNIKWSDHEKGFLNTREAGFSSHNIEVEKSSSSEVLSPCLSISPKKLDWEENYIYHPSVAFVLLKNICNDNVIKVYEPFTTDSQFYPFNYSEVDLAPGETTYISFVFLPKWLGLSSAELVLLTSLGGFLIQARGSVIESPHKLDVSSGGWLSLNLNLNLSLTPILNEVTFSPYTEGKDLTEICMKLLRPSEGNKQSVMVPHIEAVGSCDESETTVLVSVTNSASHLLKVVKITQVGEGKKLFKIKFTEGLLLFPGSVTQVALVTYDTSNVNYDEVAEMVHAHMNCGIQIVVNDSSSNSIDVPCQNIFGICSRSGFLSSIERSSVLTKTMENSKVDEFVIERWREQSTMRELYLLDDHELVFPMVPLHGYFSKSFTVKNPSQKPVLVQLILDPSETVYNCKLYSNSHIPSPLIHHDSAGARKYGFYMLKTAVTEAFLHPYGSAVLGPIFFHPSNRCEWKSSALLRNNLSGVEQLSLHGFGGLHSLSLLEGNNLKHNPKVHFNIEASSSGCRTPLSTKLTALNSGDFDTKVEKIMVSGSECGFDGFLVHDCEEFALMPGESLEIEISYQADFSRSVVKRDLEFQLASGMVVLPMQASIPIDMLNLCRKSIFRVQVARYCITMGLFAVLMLFLFWFILPQMTPSDTDEYEIKVDKRSIPVVRANKTGKGKMGQIKSVHSDKADSVLEIKTGITVEPFDRKTGEFPDVEKKSVETDRSSKEASLTVRTRKDKRRRAKKRSGATTGPTSGLMAAHLEVSSSQSGNSTPSSPMSPITTLPSENMRSREFSSKKVADSVGPVEVSGTCRAMMMTSATFPGSGRSVPGPPSLYQPRLAISPDARAPGPKIKPCKVIEAEEKKNVEGRFIYDIWGNHFPGLHLLGRSESEGSLAEYIKGHSGSFFVREPHQTLLINSFPASVTAYSAVLCFLTLLMINNSVTIETPTNGKERKVGCIVLYGSIRNRLFFE